MTSDERKQKYGKVGERNGMYGKTHTDETRKNFSELHKGNTYCKGIVSSEKPDKNVRKRKIKNWRKKSILWKTSFRRNYSKIKEKSKGRLPPNTIKISIDNIIYISISEAARQLNMPAPTVLWCLKSKNPKFNNYKYLNEETP